MSCKIKILKTARQSKVVKVSIPFVFSIAFSCFNCFCLLLQLKYFQKRCYAFFLNETELSMNITKANHASHPPVFSNKPRKTETFRIDFLSNGFRTATRSVFSPKRQTFSPSYRATNSAETFRDVLSVFSILKQMCFSSQENSFVEDSSIS